MEAEPSSTPETDAIVDEILRGERVLVFVPGTLAFVSTIMTWVLGSSFALASTGIFLLRHRFSGWPWAILVAILANITVGVVPILLVIAGSPPAYPALVFVVRAWLLIAATCWTSAVVGWISMPAPPYAIAAAALILCHFSIRSVACLTYVNFRKRFRVRKQQRQKEIADLLTKRSGRA
jgi:hypothetical protein